MWFENHSNLSRRVVHVKCPSLLQLSNVGLCIICASLSGRPIIIRMYDNFKVLYCMGNMRIQDANLFICDPGAQKQSKVAGVYL